MLKWFKYFFLPEIEIPYISCNLQNIGVNSIKKTFLMTSKTCSLPKIVQRRPFEGNKIYFLSEKTPIFCIIRRIQYTWQKKCFKDLSIATQVGKNSSQSRALCMPCCDSAGAGTANITRWGHRYWAKWNGSTTLLTVHYYLI